MPSTFEFLYRELVQDILHSGGRRTTRNADTFSTFGNTLCVDTLLDGRFPVLSGRKIFYTGVFAEFAAFMRQPKSAEDFEKFGCNYWKQWADEDGALRVDYGNAWRDFNGFDQIQYVIDTLKNDPSSRRMLVTGWRPDKLAELSLPCCHTLYQWYVNPDTSRLEMIWYQRSVDVMVGLPSNIILAALWNVLLAKEVGLQPGHITMMLGDTHIYASHVEAARQYVEQAKYAATAPKYSVAESTSLLEFKPDDIKLDYYWPSNKLKFEVYK